MPSISRQYHPPSCRLEITAKISALSRWAQRPILQSVNFLLSFPEISGKHHEPLEIRGDREQLQLLSDTVADYVQGIVGQSLQTSVFNPASALAKPAEAIDTTPSTTSVSDEKHTSSSHPHPPVLHSRTLLTHELVLGTLATNAENPSVCLKTSQLFDLVSALDDCADELEILPLPTPARKHRIPVWASSAAMVVLILGVTTATLQITQHSPSETEDLVTRSDQPNQPDQAIPSAEIDGVSSAPTSNSEPKYQLPTTAPTDSSKPKTQSPETAPKKATSPSPKTTAGQTPQASPETSTASPLITLAPRQERRAPSPTEPSAPLAQSQPPVRIPHGQSKDEEAIALADQPVSSKPSPTPGNPTSLNAKLPNRPIAASPTTSNASTSETAPVDAGPNAEALHESDQLDGPAGADDRKSRHQLGRQAPSTSTFARTRDLQPQALEVRQYISQRWRAPAGLTQPLQYQLTLNVNGSLRQVNPLDPSAAQYLSQVPLPAVNRPFISPINSSSPTQVRLVLKPDGTVQTFVDYPPQRINN